MLGHACKVINFLSNLSFVVSLVGFLTARGFLEKFERHLMGLHFDGLTLVVLVMGVSYFWMLWRDVRRSLPALWDRALKQEFKGLHPIIELHYKDRVNTSRSIDRAAATAFSVQTDATTKFMLDFSRVITGLNRLGISLPKEDATYSDWTEYFFNLIEIARIGDVHGARLKFNEKIALRDRVLERVRKLLSKFRSAKH